MRKVDLHIHSYASDGQWSEEEIIENIDKLNIKIFSVCDHDELGAIHKMVKLTKERDDLIYIKGVEATVVYNGMEHHILTYNIDENDTKLKKLLSTNLNTRIEYNTKMVEWLSERYDNISLADYEAYDFNPYQGGWKTFVYLRDKGLIKDLRDYFYKVSGFTYEKTFLKPEDYIPEMKKLGYITVLAHPPAYCGDDLYDYRELDYFRELGLAGIECFSPYFSDLSSSNYYTNYCKQHNMIITGGSDCHGGFVGRQLGYPHVDESMITLNKLRSLHGD